MKTTTNKNTTMNPLYANSLLNYSDFHLINERICLINKPLNDFQITQFLAIIEKYKNYSIQQIDEELLLKDGQYMDLIYEIVR